MNLVFPSATGTPLRNRNFRRDVFDDAVHSAQLDITPHNLRDTAASLAIQAGASVVAVARLLGHESAATTLNNYAGLFPSDLDDVAHRLNAAARRVQQRDRSAHDVPVKRKRRWVPANEVVDSLNNLLVDDGLELDIYGPAEVQEASRPNEGSDSRRDAESDGSGQ